MADHIHMALASFREEILTSTARLEFQLRDMNQRIAAQINNPNAVRGCARNDKFWAEDSDSDVISVHRHDELENRIRVLEGTIQMLLENQKKAASSKASSVTTTIEHDLLSMQAPENTRNIIVKSHCGTPALAAAVAAANAPQPPALALPVGATTVGVEDDEDDEEVVVEEATVVEEDDEQETDEVVGGTAAEDTHEVVEEADEEADDEDDGPTLTRMVLNNQVYFVDEENTAYQETEDGYEEVGVFNPATKRVEVVVEEDVEEEAEEEEQEEEEEEGIEVEEFLYKGKTYARDAENNVYLDGEQIGTWNGKKIVPLT